MLYVGVNSSATPDAPDHGLPLLLLHGFTGSSAEWRPVLPYWEGQHTLVAPDLIGHGQSPAPTDPTCYTMERCVTDLLALLDALGLARVALLGYSMGGRVALHLAAAAPERVARLILASASPGLATAQERAARISSDNALAAQIEQQGLVWFVDHWAAIPLFASQAALPAATRAELRARRLRGTPHGYANSLRGMGTGQQASLWDHLPALTMPTLLLSGQLDVKFMAINARMATLLPHARHVIVPQAGHAIHLEQPAAFAELVCSFLR
ncbi:MAG: 2-succinyl-6-hydroxy-2,4-cyclohexadiene-1-carboxylate synthase [Candidatus Viridilinea halotolerans]|uniref:Putative 2-succinyl-6-hydroxy-2,4-cyclohexadiene-1-carboxylate synthase n=1 Tax=Candidatus Viridilinea halotolerans TaxID=2491704 RepID=A0A426U544_9CHLR|nr:MAG: 2-succinyl-6-hydroxy-2,4-cyclohexadiene-1-carboxylate synthase [Candidatus Viridilinea halotolerans]